MKNILTKVTVLLALIGLSYTSAKAQYVTVQDSNFVAWLTSNYPSCMIGNQMDTTCAAIVNETSLIIPNQILLPIYNIDEIKYFDNLLRFYASDNSFGNIQRFPQEIRYLYITGVTMSSIPSLPANLDTLIIGACFLQNIVGVFPDSILHIDLYSNSLQSIPTLPNTVKYFNIGGNPVGPQLQAVLDILPNGLNTLGLNYCGLNSLPLLPDSLTNLSCEGNVINNLPPLPNGLQALNVGGNPLGSLPNLPHSLLNFRASNCNLTYFDTLPEIASLECNNNNLTSLPPLSASIGVLLCNNNQLTNLTGNFDSLYVLQCANNQLTSLPNFTLFLSALICNNNLITCFDEFSTSLINSNFFDISGNPFHCVPNYVAAMDPVFLATYPLCVYGDTISNPNNCADARGILGSTFYDANSNCLKDANDLNLSNIKVNFFNPINNDFGSIYSHYGVFNNPLPPATYLVSIDTTSAYYTVDCNYPGIDTLVEVTTMNPLTDSINFSLKCKNGFDVGVQSAVVEIGIVFPGQLHQINIKAGDLSQWFGLDCAQGASGQLTITFNGPIAFVGPSPLALTPIVSGNTLTYNINDFGNVDISTAFQLIFSTDTTAQSGDQVCLNFQLSASLPEINTNNNSLNFCYTVVNSYDPNYKEVYPINVQPGFQDWLTYTIHFQNLGNAPAFNVKIIDTLDVNLDPQTFEVLNYSHFNTTSLQNSILSFRFPNIMLPDSASNPAGSQGFVQYRIKPIANLPLGTQIENTAHIYFDFNPAIVTNTTTNNFVTTVGNSLTNENNKLFVYPNPSTGFYMISESANIEVYNLIGTLILSDKNVTSIDLSDKPKGVYFVKMNGTVIKKLIKN